MLLVSISFFLSLTLFLFFSYFIVWFWSIFCFFYFTDVFIYLYIRVSVCLSVCYVCFLFGQVVLSSSCTSFGLTGCPSVHQSISQSVSQLSQFCFSFFYLYSCERRGGSGGGGGSGGSCLLLLLLLLLFLHNFFSSIHFSNIHFLYFSIFSNLFSRYFVPLCVFFGNVLKFHQFLFKYIISRRFVRVGVM